MTKVNTLSRKQVAEQVDMASILFAVATVQQLIAL